MLVSVAIPCYQSARTIDSVVKEIREEFLKHSGYSYQIILVNDGSPDNTFEIIRQICEEDKSVIGINLSRNYSQANAKMAALPYAKGEILVYMDDDGQHPAEGIFELVRKIEEGYDLVYGRFTKKKTTAFKKITSDWNNAIRERLGVKPKGIMITSFMALNRLLIDKAIEYRSPAPSLGAYLIRVTTRVANVEVEHRTRLAGKSGYTLQKLVSLALNGYTNFTILPLRFACYTGVITAFIGLIYGAFLIIKKIIHPTFLAGYASITAVFLFISGMIMFMLGILGEYVGRMYMLLSNDPQYTVREVVGFIEAENARICERD